MWTARLRNLSLLLAASALMGCVHLTAPSTVRAPLDASLLEPCPPLSLLADGDSKTVLRWMLVSADAYQDCASKHQRLVEAVR